MGHYSNTHGLIVHYIVDLLRTLPPPQQTTRPVERGSHSREQGAGCPRSAWNSISSAASWCRPGGNGRQTSHDGAVALEEGQGSVVAEVIEGGAGRAIHIGHRCYYVDPGNTKYCPSNSSGSQFKLHLM